VHSTVGCGRDSSGRKGHFLAAKFLVAPTRTKTIYLSIEEERHMTWPGEGLLIKLWETLAEKGIGGLLTP
jgi:hypothetical protein